MRALSSLGKLKQRHIESLVAYLFVAPDLVGLSIFVVLPILMAFFISFTEWSALYTPSFTGIDNYLDIFRDKRWWGSVQVTLIYVIVAAPLELMLSLGLALFVNSKIFKFRNFFRMVYFTPFMLPLVVVAVTWKFIFDPLDGLLNNLLQIVGLPTLLWLGSKDTALLSIIMVDVWWNVGYFMVLFVAGLNDIPGDYHDAAAIDGATPPQSFWYITLPLLRPTLVFILVILTIGSFQVFDLVYVLTRGGPARATYVNVLYIYDKAFKDLDFGYSSAMAFLLFTATFLFSVIQLKVMRTGRID